MREDDDEESVSSGTRKMRERQSKSSAMSTLADIIAHEKSEVVDFSGDSDTSFILNYSNSSFSSLSSEYSSPKKKKS